MSLSEFSRLHESAQAQVLIERGIFLAERLYKSIMIFLYQVDDFYVEVYHNLRFNVIQGITGFKDEDVLQPYLESIDISQLCAAE